MHTKYAPQILNKFMILTNSIKLKWETSIECWMLTCDSKHNLQIEVFKTCGRTMSPRANTIIKIKIIMNDPETSLTASDPAAGWGGGQETWNKCGRLWAPSFLWLISTGLGGAMAPSAPPLDPLLIDAKIIWGDALPRAGGELVHRQYAWACPALPELNFQPTFHFFKKILNTQITHVRQQWIESISVLSEQILCLLV